MNEQFGSRPQNLIAVIGPGIANCCFEVGMEVACEFRDLFPERDLSTRTRIDLVEANRRQLRQTGIPEGQIVSAGHCTCCNPQVFHSFRRDREASGRMLSAVGIKG
jgi:copper oxidase (laccase) domain-containing protein